MMCDLYIYSVIDDECAHTSHLYGTTHTHCADSCNTYTNDSPYGHETYSENFRYRGTSAGGITTKQNAHWQVLLQAESLTFAPDRHARA